MRTHRTLPGIAGLAVVLSLNLGLGSVPQVLAGEDDRTTEPDTAPEAAPGAVQGAAMVLDAIGTIDPEVEAFTVLPMGTEIALSDRAEIEFIDLNTCDLVRVIGGMLVLGDEITQKGGTVLKREPAECPESFDLDGESMPGGVVLRAMPF